MIHKSNQTFFFQEFKWDLPLHTPQQSRAQNGGTCFLAFLEDVFLNISFYANRGLAR